MMRLVEAMREQRYNECNDSMRCQVNTEEDTAGCRQIGLSDLHGNILGKMDHKELFNLAVKALNDFKSQEQGVQEYAARFIKDSCKVICFCL